MSTLLNRSFVSVIFAQIASLFGDAVLRFALPLYVLNQRARRRSWARCRLARDSLHRADAHRRGCGRPREQAAHHGGARYPSGCDVCGVSRTRRRHRPRPVHLRAVSSCTPRRACTSPPCRRRCRSSSRATASCGTAIVSQISALSGLLLVLGGLLFGLFGIEPVVFVSGAAFAVSAVLIVTVVRIPRDAIERSGVGVVRTVANDIVEKLRVSAPRTHGHPQGDLPGGGHQRHADGVHPHRRAGCDHADPGSAEPVHGLRRGCAGVGRFGGRRLGGRVRRAFALSAGAPLFLLVAALGLLPIAVVLGVPMDAMLAYGIVVAGLFASMACATMFSIQAISFVQLETPGHLVGKVIALTMSLANCAQPVGSHLRRPVRRAARHLVPVALGTAAIAFVIGLVTFAC